MDFLEQPHRRYNPLTGEWLLVSPQRARRPWQGQVAKPNRAQLLEHDPKCYLCPGNTRNEGQKNPDYRGVFAFDNDFPALLTGAGTGQLDQDGLLRAHPERGCCRVICFTHRHDWTLSEMPAPDVRQVVDVWAEETSRLGHLDYIHHVQVFENKGEMMGCSNPHPHCQVWATASIPNEPAKELAQLAAWRLARPGHCLLCDYLALEERAGERIVFADQHLVVLVPFWAVWPFELLLILRDHQPRLDTLDGPSREALAAALVRVSRLYDRLFDCRFPYSMGFHQAPTDGFAHDECHLHAHWYPPLLRNAEIRKFMVGFEMLGNPQRDLTAETAAQRLREAMARV